MPEIVDQHSLSSHLIRVVDSARKSMFVMGSILLLFTAARNSVTWHFQRFWGGSHDFWQRLWGIVCDIFNDDCDLMNNVGTFAVTGLFFWAFNAIFLWLDTQNWPSWFFRYKLQEDKNLPVEWPKLKRALKQVLINQFFVSWPIMVFVFHPLAKWRGCSCSRELPTFHWVLFEFMVFILIEELGFYYSHRLLHHPVFYRHVHKQHHEWTAPIGIIAIYAHPVEHVLSNLVPPMIGILVMGSHIATQWMWFCLAIASAINAHCGYHFPFFPSPEAHDYHHLKFNQCYGVLGILDRLHGTDSMFRETKMYQRHIMCLSLVPLKQLYPNVEKEWKELNDGVQAAEEAQEGQTKEACNPAQTLQL